jgi:hypothetical protein
LLLRGNDCRSCIQEQAFYVVIELGDLRRH